MSVMTRAERAFFLSVAFLIATVLSLINDWPSTTWFGLFTFISMYVCYDSED